MRRWRAKLRLSAGSIRPREAAVVQDVEPGHVIGERRQQALNGYGDLFGCAVLPERDIRRLFRKTLLEGDTRTGSPLFETCPIPRCERAPERKRIHMNALLAQREGQRLRLGELGATNDVAGRIVAQHLNG